MKRTNVAIVKRTILMYRLRGSSKWVSTNEVLSSQDVAIATMRLLRSKGEPWASADYDFRTV
jgi:hypothetical protein